MHDLRIRKLLRSRGNREDVPSKECLDTELEMTMGSATDSAGLCRQGKYEAENSAGNWNVTIAKCTWQD